MKRRAISAFLCLCIVLSLAALAGCGNGDASTHSASTPASSESNNIPVGEEYENNAEPVGEAQYGGVLKIGLNAAAATPGYPALVTMNSGLNFCRPAYESLLTIDEDGVLQPWLATSWKIDIEEPSITWTLREGVTFSDGEPFNADAVKVNIEEYQKNVRSEVGTIASMEIINDYEIKMILNNWNSAALESIGIFVLYMSPKALADGAEANYNVTTGTGPFIMTEFTPNVSWKYTRNENYWQEGKPYLDGVEFTYIAEPTALEAALAAGDVDIIHTSPVSVQNFIDTYTEDFEAGKYTIVQNDNGFGVVTHGLIPCSIDPNSPWADARVRRALAYAIDTQAIMEAFQYGRAIATNQWALPGSATYNEDLVGCEYNPEKARELLAEAGFADGFDTTLYCYMEQDMFTAVAEMLNAVGIRAKVEVIDFATYMTHMTGTWEGLTIHVATISPDLGLYMGRQLGDDGSFYKNGIVRPAEAIELLEKIRAAEADEEKHAYTMELQEYIYNGEDGEMIFGVPLYALPACLIKNSYVHNDSWTIQLDSTVMNMQDAWMSK